MQQDDVVAVLRVRDTVVARPQLPQSRPSVDQPRVRHTEIRSMLLQQRHMPSECRGSRAFTDPEQL